MRGDQSASVFLCVIILVNFYFLKWTLAGNSVPIPYYMLDLIEAGRLTYDKQSTPTQLLGKSTFESILTRKQQMLFTLKKDKQMTKNLANDIRE